MSWRFSDRYRKWSDAATPSAIWRMYNVGQLPEGQKPPEGGPEKTLSDFTDCGQAAPWASEAMTRLVEAGAVAGSGGALNPAAAVKRAEMAQMLYNLISISPPEAGKYGADAAAEH